MFCSECGQPAAGKFCCHCGHALTGTPVPAADWRESLDYFVVSEAPEVAHALKRAELLAKRNDGGDAVLSIADTVASALMGGLSAITLAKLIQPFYTRMGVQTGQQRTEVVAMPPGQAIACLLFALTSQSQPLIDIQQTDSSCTLVAQLPSDWRSLNGKQTIMLTRHPQGTQLHVHAQVLGQMFDYGKCAKSLDRLFGSFHRAA